MRAHRTGLRVETFLLVLGCVSGLGRVAVAQNLHWGPVRGTVGVTAGAEYRDNANTSEHDPKSDVTLTIGPTFSGGVFLPFAGGEEFTLLMSATYSHSINGVQPDSFGAPLTASLLLPIYVEQWTLTLSDSFNFRNDPLESTFAVNRSQVQQYSNVASASASRQLGKFATTFAVQRNDNFFPDDPDQEETDYQFSFTPSFTLREGYSVFLRNSYGITQLADPMLRDSTGITIEAGVNGQITPSLNGTISLGWSHSELAATATNGIDHIDGISSTMSVSYTHPLRPNTTHSIAFFRSPGVSLLLKDSSITETTGLAYTIAHRLNRFVTLSPNITWTHLQSLSGSKEIADIYQVGFGLSRQFTKHLSASFGYRYQVRSSNLPNSSYDVNDITVSGNYSF